MDSTTTESGLRATNNILEHISEKPWSDYTAADYSVEQWHASCLIHLHQGAPSSKGECKLPVKTPNGAVNRNGVHAAAAALAGARGGVNAPSDKKASAARALRGLYRQLDEEAPDSLKQSSLETIDDVLEHVGVKGMRWGVRKKPSPRPSFIGKDGKPLSKRKQTKAPSEDASRAADYRQRAKKGGSRTLSNKELKDLVDRMNLEQQYVNLTVPKKKSSAGKKFAQEILRDQAKRQVNTLISDPRAAAAKVEKVLSGLENLGKYDIKIKNL